MRQVNYHPLMLRYIGEFKKIVVDKNIKSV